MGTATNPLLKGDVPDVSVLRAGDAFYMVSTTMYFSPVAPIMKSYDLVNWKIVNYCADILEDLPQFKLEKEDETILGEYGRGQWASSLRHHGNRYYVTFTNNSTNKTYIFYTTDIEKEGSWQRIELDRQFHDPSLFFDDDGVAYIFSGYGNVQLTEMERNLRAVKEGGMDLSVIPTPNVSGAQNAEGAQVYKRDDKYYIFLIGWVSGKRAELCYRSASITGPYEGKVVLNVGLGSRSGGVAQGSIIDTPDGDWYGFFFQDRDSAGRMPVLVPMTWGEDGWPVFTSPIPESFEIKQEQDFKTNLYVSDEFDETKLPFAWQWNHNPDNDCWSLTERPGYLRITTGRTSKTVYHARNTLTQRTFEPACEGTISLEPTDMRDGDVAGLIALQATSGFVGIEQEAGQKYIVMYTGLNSGSDRGSAAKVTRQEKIDFTGTKIWFKVNFEFRAGGTSETAVFSYSLDGAAWQSIGTTVTLAYTLPHFTGYRFGLFNYATQTAGGYVDFDYFHVEEN
jgi:beta-xylosidase